jgi:hypothetical protein
LTVQPSAQYGRPQDRAGCCHQQLHGGQADRADPAHRPPPRGRSL